MPLKAKRSFVKFLLTEVIWPISLWPNLLMSLRLSMIVDGPESKELILAFNDTVPLHDGASFGPVICKADCNPPCHFQWKKVTWDGHISDVINEATLPKQVVHVKGVLKYRCVVTGFYANSYGSKSVSRELTLNIRCTLFTYISSVLVIKA